MQLSDEASETVDEIVADALLVDESEFDDDTPFDDDGLAAESLDIVEMAELVEDELGVHVPDEDLEELTTVGAVKSYVAERRD
ncbi:phosphopantetheine-binding protein [Halobaculum sp. MBLA0143]|uniref:phosphopantetheine-binding protein n=1 Tax=Halobaculum sp. MBLA0143 TaxID=3079933 RepID=UPI003525CADF